jgi:phage gpG-like protein
VAISVEENIALLKAIRDQATTAAAPAADGMAETFEDAVGRTLRLSAHGPMPAGPPHSIPFGIFYKATPGAPPAYATGNLARSIIRTAASGEITASALVGATAVYAALQEWGGSTWPSRSAYMHWTNTRGSWWMRRVDVPEHPYMRPTVDRTVHDGSLTAAAMEAFEAHMTLLNG